MNTQYHKGDIVRNKRTGREAEVCEPPFGNESFLRVNIVFVTGYIVKRAWSLKNVEIIKSKKY